MSWQDRHYNRNNNSGDGFNETLRRILFFSFPIGTYLNIRVRVNWTFLLLPLYHLFDTNDAWWTLRYTVLLFLSVLLHEYGHALACRKVGGQADDIMMGPLGGIAYCAPPNRPWPQFVTVIWGPLVNVIIAGACALVLLATVGFPDYFFFTPFKMWLTNAPGLQGILLDLLAVNVGLLMFNLCMLFLPFDGGRIVQIILWTKLGYFKSMLIATRVGMAGAVVIALIGISIRDSLLVMIAFFGFITCYQQAMLLKQAEAEGGAVGFRGMMGESEFDPDNPGRFAEPREAKPGWFKRMRMKAAARKRAAEIAENERLEAEVDRILVKVKEQGLQSLTEKEKKTLQRATEKQRRVG